MDAIRIASRSAIRATWATVDQAPASANYALKTATSTSAKRTLNTTALNAQKATTLLRAQ